jgi:hypothetical protein
MVVYGFVSTVSPEKRELLPLIFELRADNDDNTPPHFRYRHPQEKYLTKLSKYDYFL